MTTNGLLISRYQNELLNSPSLRQINFSLQAFTDNFPDKTLEPYLSKILDFCLKAGSLAPAMYQNLRLWNLKAADIDYDLIDEGVDRIFALKKDIMNI